MQYTIHLPLNQINQTIQSNAIEALESGHIIYYPTNSFKVETSESFIFHTKMMPQKQKNISYDFKFNKLTGLGTHISKNESQKLLEMMKRFAVFAKSLVETTFPKYSSDLQWGRTSYRPAEIQDRKTSKRQDDTRLHVDSFPSTPVNGWRILRIFSNINPHNEDRMWQVGEPFPKVIQQFSPRLKPYRPLKAYFLKYIKATRNLRSAYDHYMLMLHDAMKLDETYQKEVDKVNMMFPAQSSWVVFTDQVSHAALCGRFALEQTFYLPVRAMESPDTSPFAHLRALNFIQ